MPKSTSRAHVVANKGLEFCDSLYAIERDLKDATIEERYNERLARSRPVLDTFRAWLNEESPRVLPKSALGSAIAYCKNQWNKLTTFLEDGRLEIDNNRSERSIKPHVLGERIGSSLIPLKVLRPVLFATVSLKQLRKTD